MSPVRVIPPPPGPASFQGLQAWYKADSFAGAHREPGSISGLRAHYKADGLVASSPDTLSDLAAWYKADSITGLADGAAVSQWDDSSGNERHATQGTAGNRPLYKTNILNGGPVVRFDGTSDFMSATMTVPQPFTMFAVVKHDDTAGTFQVFLDGDGSGGLFTQLIRNSTNAHAIFASGGGIISQADSNANWNIHVGAFHTNGGSIRNGVHVVGTPGTGALTNLTIGAQGPGNLRFLNGDIAEIIIFSRTLTTAEREQVERYLSVKYAINTAISAWTDVAGGFTASQATNANKPLYVPSVAGFNNKPTVRFVTDDRLDTSASIFNLAQPYQVVVVAKTNGAAGNHAFVGNSSGGTFLFYQEITTGQLKMYAGTNQTLATGTMVGAAHVLSGMYNGVSGVGSVDGRNLTVPGTVGPNALTDIRLGDFGTGTFPLDGDIAEIMVYDRALTAAEQEGLGLYLANKYGITSYSVGNVSPAKGTVSLVQTAGPNKPVLVQNAMNGKPVFRFTAASTQRLDAESAISLSQPGVIFLVAKVSPTAVQFNLADSLSGGRWTPHVPGTGLAAIFAGFTITTGVVVDDDVTRVWAGVFNGASSKLYLNGGAAAVSGDAGSQGFGQLRLGAASDLSSPLTGDIGEVLIYNQNLSLTAINVIGRYLAQKWGTTWTTAT